jgi:pimeloyl-ACP methyl ester carboxylesterase
MRVIFFFIILFIAISGQSQEKVSFYSSDSLKITADLYINNYNLPFIILFHQAKSSRGEYIEIAPKLISLGYNCLAVDLRKGGEINYIRNETAERANKQNLHSRNTDTEKDMLAAIQYLKKYNNKPIILFGSSYSASLSLMLAKKLDNIKAVIAFSPGEYLRPEVNVKDQISGLNLPVFAAATTLEYKYVNEILANVGPDQKFLFKPSSGRGIHGARALWQNSEGNKEFWFQLTYFIGKLKEI